MQHSAVLNNFSATRSDAAVQLREHADRHLELDHFFELSHEILCILDKQARFRRLNEVARRVLDVAPNQSDGHSFLQIVHPNYRAFAQEQIRVACEQPELVRFTVLCQCHYNSERWIEWSIRRSEEPATLIVVGRELTVSTSDKPDRFTRARANPLIGSLSPREWEVLQLVVAGNANKVIARRLGLSEKTVERHRSHGMKKLQVSSVPDLVRLVEFGNL